VSVEKLIVLWGEGDAEVGDVLMVDIHRKLRCDFWVTVKRRKERPDVPSVQTFIGVKVSNAYLFSFHTEGRGSSIS
jgi:hypothetical protein